MKKLKKEEELKFLLSTSNEKLMYVANFGICPPNQEKLMSNHQEIFLEVAPSCKNLSQDILSAMIEAKDKRYIDVVMTRCLSEDNQLKFIEHYPQKVNLYLDNLEKLLPEDRGAYLSREAEDFYQSLCEKDTSLVRLKRTLSHKSAGNCPFEGLAGLLG